MPPIQKILYATDLSPNSAFVFRFAVDAARNHNAGIVILHVIEPLSPTTELMMSYHLEEGKRRALLQEHIEAVRAQIRERLDAFCEKELRGDPIAARRVEQIEVVRGVAVDEIIRRSESYGCNLIVMGTHGKGIIRSTFLGSTARRLLRRIRIPVLVVPMPESTTDDMLNAI
ncbi:MAG TPA: universal stress protein [Desulfobacterales bacterium]